MKFLIYALAAVAILATPALAAPNRASMARQFPQLRGARMPVFRVIGRFYYPFWGGFCSNAPLGPLINPQWYYCYPGYAWDYGQPYYWAYYSSNDTLVASLDPESTTNANNCGDWVWRSVEKKYSWDSTVCQPPSPSP
jgi:hypothetical protein